MQQMEWREALDEAQRRATAVERARRRSSRAHAKRARARARCGDARQRRGLRRRGAAGAAADVRRALCASDTRSVDASASASLESRLTHDGLLQISEPGESPDPHQRRIAVGIDLGTTHSLVAAVRNGVAECLPDEDGRRAAAVGRALSAPTGARQIGCAALADAARDPRNTIVSVKRFMGRGLARHRRRASKLPYDFVDAPGMVQICAPRRRASRRSRSRPRSSRRCASAPRTRFADDLFGAVITVPAYFDDAQRQATKDAARARRARTCCA